MLELIKHGLCRVTFGLGLMLMTMAYKIDEFLAMSLMREAREAIE